MIDPKVFLEWPKHVNVTPAAKKAINRLTPLGKVTPVVYRLMLIHSHIESIRQRLSNPGFHENTFHAGGVFSTSTDGGLVVWDAIVPGSTERTTTILVKAAELRHYEKEYEAACIRWREQQ